MTADEFNKWALAVVAIAALFAGPFMQWLIAQRQANLQEGISRRQIADSIAKKRRDWIESLQADIATMLAQYTQFDETTNWSQEPSFSQESRLNYAKEADAAALVAYESMLRVRLRLSPQKEMHQALLEKMDVLREYFVEILHKGNPQPEGALVSARDGIVDAARALLHAEWDKIFEVQKQMAPTANE